MNINVLIVDDKQSNLISLELLINQISSKSNVIKAQSANEALDILLKKQIDLILCDIQMPIMDGFEFANLLKQNHKTKNIPLIFLTAIHKDKQSQKRGFDLGAIDYITKPIDEIQLTNKIKIYEKLILLQKQMKQDELVYAKAIEDNSPNIIIITKENKIKHANKKFFEFTGYTTLNNFKKDHQCISDFFEEKSDFIQKNINNTYWIDYILSTPNEPHIAIIKKDSKDYYFQIHCSKINTDKHTEYITTFEDITEIKNINQELYKLKSAIENSPISIVITDTEGKLEYVNPWFSKVTGYSYKEAIGMNPNILKTGYTKDEEYRELWTEITHDHIWRGVFKNKKKNGQEYWESVLITPIHNSDGNIINYLGIKQEITEQVYLRQEIKEQEEIMIAQSRHAAMGEMISMIAHQWRQPLSIISMGVNNILADIELDLLNKETLKGTAFEIITQTQKLSKTIDDFKDFFKPNKEKEETTIDKILSDTFNVIGNSLENNDIQVITNYKSTKTIKTYPREIMQVFINILKNAKEVLLEKNIKTKQIFIITEDIENSINIKICDNALGISQDIMNQIFNPYFTTKNQQNGTGLGLYISRTIIEKNLLGSIKAYNKNDGVCFEIILPREI